MTVSSKSRWLVPWAAAAAAAFLALQFFSSGSSSIAAGADGNILKNAGFEERGNDVPGWTIELKTADQGRISIGTGKQHSGSAALQLSPNNRNKPMGTGEGPLRVAQGFPGSSFRGKQVHVAGWLAAEGGATAVVGALVLRKNGAAHFVELRVENSSDFEYREDVLAVPDVGDILFLIVGCSVEGTGGSAYFDDVYVGTQPPARPARERRGGAAPPAQPAVSAGSGDLTATIDVDAGRQIREIPRTLYGANIEWIWNANGIWNEKSRAIDSDIVNLTREAGVSLLRFPGGIFSDVYHWKDAIGPQSSRREAEHTPGGPKSRLSFGTDEALEFARRVGGELLITVNAGTGTAQEAAEWVRYVNGRGGQRVRFWEIGNEIYVNDGTRAGRAITKKPDEYARRVVEFAAAMRAADPSIRIGAISNENYSRSVTHSYRNWTEEVLGRSAKQIDFLSVHLGYAPMLTSDGGWDVRTVYSALLAAPQLIKAGLDKVADKVDRLAGARGPEISLAITEWGPLFQGQPNERFVDHVKTLGSGLFVASALKAFLETPKAEIATFFKLVDPLYLGWIGSKDGKWLAKPPLLALQMYTRHFGDVLVGSTARSPTYDSVTVGWVDAAHNVPYLDAVASRSRDGRTLYILAVNKNFDKPVKASIRVSGFRPQEGTAWVLSGPSLDANTGTEPLAVPGVKWGRQATLEKNSRFYKGAANEVRISSSPVEAVGEQFEFSFAPHSVTSLELRGGTARSISRDVPRRRRR